MDNNGLKESRKLFVIQCLCINDNERYSAWQQILLTNSDPISSTECFWPESLESLEFSQMYHTAHPTFFWFSQDR